MLSIIRLLQQGKPQVDPRELYIAAMFLLWASRPSKRECEPDGSYFIGDMSEARLQDQRLNRETPYSVCKGIRD
jgi:hypothetical protein